MFTRENVRAKVGSSDEIPSGEFDSGPPIGIDKNLIVEPVRNQLLAGLRAPKLPKLRGKLRLAATRNFDSALQCNNVVLLHGPAKYTRNLVDVNKNPCLTADKETCTVLDMAPHKKLREPPKPVRRKPKTVPEVGPDGLTLAQRVMKLMVEHDIGQTKLAKMCSEYYATFVPGTEDKVKQQHIFNLLQGQSNAWCLPFVAAVFDVSDMWLQFGIGRKERHLKN